jgi:hypothetical protein
VVGSLNIFYQIRLQRLRNFKASEKRIYQPLNTNVRAYCIQLGDQQSTCVVMYTQFLNLYIMLRLQKRPGSTQGVRSTPVTGRGGL